MHSSPRGAARPLVFPGGERLVPKLRRRWRSRGRYRGMRYWLSSRGAGILGVFAGLFCLNGFFIGWREAYDVTIQITSPAATRVPVLAWLLSLCGWLMMPGLAGAVAGYLVSTGINRQRTRPLESSPSDGTTAAPRHIPTLMELYFPGNEYGVAQQFLERFVAVAHGGDWPLAQDHWERQVALILGSDAVEQDASGAEALRQAVTRGVELLTSAQGCPRCAAHTHSSANGGRRNEGGPRSDPDRAPSPIGEEP